MGEVYRARDPRLRREVAVKVLISGAGASPEQVRRFEDEARAAGALNHPNILSVFDVGSEGSLHYVVFELLEGTTLRERLLRGPLPHRKAVEYAVQVCRGLAAAHGKGIVHRDLKPGNLFLTHDGQVKILDFGLAKLTQALDGAEAVSAATTQTATHPGRVVGTLGYMSPEQLQGQSADARSDLFALGATLYEMLKGRPTFQRDTPAETVSAILNQEPPPLGESAEGLSLAALDAIVRRCLEKNPEERFQTARDLGFALTALSDSSPAERALPPSHGMGRKRWLIAAAVVLGAVILAPSVGQMVNRWIHSRAPTPVGPVTVVPFTSFPGVETAPTFSPDGSQIAFAWSPEGTEDQFDLYVKVIGSEKPLRLTQHPAEGLFPAWSPDGRQIAFHRWGKEGSGVYVVPALGGGERKIAETHTTYFLAALLSWSPDGKLLAYSDLSLVLLELATGEKHEIDKPAKDCQGNWVPAFSPDGKSLAFACMISDHVNRLFVTPISGTKANPIALVQGDFTGLAWSEDGKYLVFAHDGDLWRVTTSGGGPEKLLSGRDVTLPAVARTGGRLAYAQQQQNVNIWRLPLDNSARGAGAPARLVSSSRYQNNPAFSPDGRRLAFESDRSGTSEIWLCSADGSDPQRLTSFAGPLTGSPRWSPDGRWIAFDSRATGESAIYVVGADGGVPRRVQTGLADSSVPTWSKDGRWLYFSAKSEGVDQLFKVPPEGGSATQLTQHGGIQPQESGDGRRVYYLRGSEGFAEIWSVSTGGGDESLRGTPRLPPEWGGEWTVGSSGIYFVQGEPPAGIGFLDSSTGRIRRVAAIPGKPQAYGTRLGLSPDERALLYSQVDGITGDIMLIENFH
jgi:Tol biopolymer transport system component